MTDTGEFNVLWDDVCLTGMSGMEHQQWSSGFQHLFLSYPVVPMKKS